MADINKQNEDTTLKFKDACEGLELFQETKEVLKYIMEPDNMTSQIKAFNFSLTHGKKNIKIEICVKYSNNTYYLFRIINDIHAKDYTFVEIDLNSFSSIKERNNVIYNYYKERKYSQIFLAGLFGLTQSQISRIIKTVAEQKGEAKKSRNLRAFDTSNLFEN